ncbi:hypothetical protein ACF3M2_16495 [Tissierella carlieri]|jgi:hypothetical protein|uniref:hypothetical protein n=1 Tax=Tissierella carlieri TaxID=689904 RepID=UPI002913B2D1|nr:hypothetical protein [Bacillota bacterium]
MIKKFLTTVFLVIILFHLQVIHAEEYEYIEIFDPKQNKVIKTVQTNEEINNMVIGWINKIDGIYAKFDPVKDDGYAIRFPLVPAIQLQNKLLNTIVKEVYLIIPKNDPPFFMVFETEDRLICFPFTGEINTLSNVLDFKLK